MVEYVKTSFRLGYYSVTTIEKESGIKEKRKSKQELAVSRKNVKMF